MQPSNLYGFGTIGSVNAADFVELLAAMLMNLQALLTLLSILVITSRLRLLGEHMVTPDSTVRIWFYYPV